MSQRMYPKTGLRRRLAVMLWVVVVLVVANLILIEGLHRRVEESAAALAGHVELYKLSRRVQVAVDGATGPNSLSLFRQQIADFDRDIDRLAELPATLKLPIAGNTELAILVEGLARDWQAFCGVYRDLRRFTAAGAANDLVLSLDRAATELQASVIAINFTLQRDRVAQFAWLQKVFYGLAAADFVILALISFWLRRRVVEPVETITAAARRLAGDDFAARVEISADDEIGELGRALNTAAERVQTLLADIARESDALREAESKFRALAEKSLVGIYLVQDGRFVYVNPRFAEIFGYSPAEMESWTSIESLVHPDDREIVREQMRRRFDGEVNSVRYEFRGVHKDGRAVSVEALGSIGGYRGRPAVIGTLDDLTGRKHAEGQILRLGRAVEQSTATVVITDRDGRIDYVNPKFTALTGYSAEEAIGRTPRLIQSGLTAPEVYADLWGCLLAGKEWQGEILNRKKSGELFWEHMVASPVRDARGEITHFIAVKEDITQRKHSEAELRRVNRTLQVLSACNQSLVHAESAQGLIDSICRNLTRLGGFPLASIGFADDAGASTIRLVACAGPAADYAFRWSDAERGKGSSGEAIRRRETLIARDLVDRLPNEHWREEARRYRLESSIAMPLLHADEVFGVLRIYSDEVDAFTPDEVRLLAELAEDVAFGLFGFRTREQVDAQATELLIRQRAIESSRNGVMITRCDTAADNPIVYVNAAFETITGHNRADVQGRNARFLLGPYWEQPEVDRLRDALRRGGEVEVTLRNVRRDGTLFWNNLSVSPVRDSQGRATHFISVINDVSDQVRYQQELKHHVTHDTLTGLANRALLHDRVDQALAHAGRSGRKIAVLMVDLDRFKLINDSFGHATGDELLRLVAARLAAIVRKGDTVARVGSDEFVVVLAELGTSEQAIEIAGKIAEAFLPVFVIGGQEAFVSASVGVSVAPDDGSDTETMLRNAEVALHAVRAQGGNGYRAYAQSMGESARDRIGIETDLRRGIERGELELFYQPKVRLEDGLIVGAEALIRWRHPERGLVPPLQFIPLAEETGLIGPIGDWVIEEALRQLSSWAAQGLPPIKVAVNLSARQFRDRDLAVRVRQMVEDSGVDPRLLELELTETMLMRRGEATVAVLGELRAAGLTLAIDDFGTGYSSLSYLQRFPIDTLKIDRSFVIDLETSHDSRVLAATILMMARNLGKTVVAEGVETIGQAEILRQAGCEIAQGYLFSRPVEAAEFVAMVRRRNLLPQPVDG